MIAIFREKSPRRQERAIGRRQAVLGPEPQRMAQDAASKIIVQETKGKRTENL
jgi:hypothetical protein